MKNIWLVGLICGIFFLGGLTLGWLYFSSQNSDLMPSPFISQNPVKTYPLEIYTFNSLRERVYEPRIISIEEEIASEELFSSYVFSYEPLGKKMTGQLNIPVDVTDETPVIVLLRGYVPLEIYSTGTGTRNAAAAYARAGFITISPDFFGYGDSDPEPEDSWQARFEKPIIVVELVESIQKLGIPLPTDSRHITNNIGLWGHSNGGQIAISVLEILREPLPTSLWAPVTAPFPYSVLFFSDEHEDEGKGMRLWINQLENDYELRDFSITQYLDGLLGPIQIHHGTADEAALISWSDEFLDKIEIENDRRENQKEILEESATQSANADDPFLEPIDISYYQYAGADHNLQPGWNTVVERDITFYTQHLKRNLSETTE